METYSGNLVLGDCITCGTIFSDRGKIKNVTGERGDGSKKCYILPGFIDIHFHGMEGVPCSPDIMGKISERLARAGVTGFLASLVPQSLKETVEGIESISSSETHHARLLGIHLEGPALNPKMRGSLDPSFFFNPTRSQWQRMTTQDVKIMTVTPEVCGNAAIEFLSRICVVSLGHSCATFMQAHRAFSKGARLASHLFNAMSFHHREPGIVGAVLESEVFFEMILDKIHVHSCIAKAIIEGREDRTILVTDSLASGLADGVYERMGKKYSIRKGACMTDGRLAGSTLSMIEAFRNALELGFSIPEASKMTSRNPARLLGLKKGLLKEGYDADLVILDEKMRVKKTVVGGEVVFESP